MSRGKRLSQLEQGKIQALRSQGLTYRQINKKIKRSCCVIHNYYKSPHTYGLKGNRGRKSTFTATDKRHIFRLASNQSISARQIKIQLGLKQSTRTIQRILAIYPTLIYKKLKKRPYMTEVHKIKRLEWARNCMNSNMQWQNIIWMDEKKFNLDGPDGFQYYWHDLRKEPKYMSRRVHGGGGIMVWTGFSWNGKTKLVIIEGSIKSTEYISILESHLLPCSKKIGGKNWKMMHDNCRIHTSKETKEWLNKNKIDVIDWPANSPDMNPIEDLWGILVRKVFENARQYYTIADLKKSVEKCWNEIASNQLHQLIDSMPNRIYELILKKGGNTEY